MKILKTALLGALALSAASFADAQTVVHIVGSTAFRNAAVVAITNILQPGYTYGYAGTSYSGANQQIYTGTTIVSNIPVIIKTSWTGSVGGIQTVSSQIPVATFLTNTTPQSTTGSSGAPSNYDPPAIPEVAFSDGFQSSTPYSTPALSDQIVGVVTFKWVCSPDSPNTMTNITPNIAQALFADGKLPLAVFTGVHTDEATNVFASGRDADSGTRLTAFAESGVGPLNLGIVQYVPTNSSGAIISRTASGPIAGQEAYPAETINSIFYDVGEGGYSSGGDLAVAVEQTNTLATISGVYVTYLGLSDSTSAIGLGAKAMSWNGISYTDTAIEEGQYSFWGYEHLMYRSNYGTVDANGKEVADLLALRIKNFDAVQAGELLSSMHATRQTDGGVVTVNY